MVEMGRNPAIAQTDRAISSDMHRVIAALSDANMLPQLRGTSKELDIQLGMVGPETLSRILAEGLPEVFQANPTLFARALALCQSVDASDNKPVLQVVATLLGDIFSDAEGLRREVQYEIFKAMHESWARRIREGERLLFWEELSLEKLFVSEYASIETEVFDRLGQKFHRVRTASGSVGTDKNSSLAELTNTADRVSYGEKDVQHLVLSGNDLTLDLFDWENMQKRARELDLSSLGALWKKEPGRSILWLLQHCTLEQLLYYVYHNANKLDGELREAFIKALRADKQGQIPLIWKTVVLQALSKVGR
jgi:hypothetical protein